VNQLLRGPIFTMFKPLQHTRRWLAAGVLWTLCAAGLAQTTAEPQFLEPEEAFKLEAQALDGHTVQLRFVVADGYYLYRDKFKFVLSPADAKPGATW
jgi:thioredoxin:protein disulfide reductase